jgi:lipopolysaccharide/colanic/teichoic acid biosynthesis glycosyltransferase
VLETAEVLELESVAAPPAQVEYRERLNDVVRLSDHLLSINQGMKDGDTLVCWAQTHYQLKRHIGATFPKILRPLPQAVHFLVHRVAPKLPATEAVYARLYEGKPRVLSLTEVLGRLVSCGFDIVDFDEVDGLTRVTAKKVGPPLCMETATYGPLVRLKRVGFGGKQIALLKLRTMHPFAEYLQAFVYDRNGLVKGDKIRGDFRVTRWGGFLRRNFLDELPMLVNLLKGELKVVGVRPLSSHKLSLYSRELQELRKQYKPGLVPPYYADMPHDLDSTQQSEIDYLAAYDRAPLRTDLSYFFRAVANILLRGARSS